MLVRRPLLLVILVPVLGLMSIVGLILYMLVLRTVSNYADDNIRASVNSLLRNALTIVDTEVDRQNREGAVDNPEAAIVYQLNARLRLEDFAREQALGIVILAGDKQDFATGLSDQDLPAVIHAAKGSIKEPIEAPSGDTFYVAATTFAPWQWRLVVAKDASGFATLIRQVNLIYAASALALLVPTSLMVMGLRRLIVRPIHAIAGEFARGHPPNYKGVEELEYLSNEIGSVLNSLTMKTQHLETALNSMSDGITVFDSDMRLVAWNPKFEQLYRHAPGVVKAGAHFTDVVRHSVERGDYGPGNPDEILAELLERARTLSPPRFEVDRADGTSIEIRRAAMPDGGLVTTYTDISSRRQKERLEVASEAKSRFLENMSHDLRKPIVAVIEDAAMLMRQLAGETRHAQVADNVRENAGHLLDMVDEILEMSRIEAGTVRVKLAQTSVESVIAQVRRVAAPLAKRKGLELTIDVPPRLDVKTDARLLARIVTNLAVNAVDYTVKGKVSIAARHDGKTLFVDVADTGPGIAVENIPLLFGKFQRLAPTAGLTKPGMGLGLGLTISREFARLLDGDITVVSELGFGSIFTVSVPAMRVGGRG
jgi:signal transduction histidine kinase